MNTNNKYFWPVVAFLGLGLIWGSNFIYTKWATELITPKQIVLFRAAIGFIVMLVYALIKKSLRLKHLKHWQHFVVMSLLATSLYYSLFASGIKLLYSGIAGAISGAIPLFSYLASLIFLKEGKNLSKLIGVVIGFIGVAVIANPFAADVASINYLGVLYMILGSICVGCSFIYAKKSISPLKIPSEAVITYQLFLSALFMLLITDLSSIDNILTSQKALLGLIFGLGFGGTAIAYFLYYYMIEKLGALGASSATYLPPVVALFIGAIFVGEPITMIDYIGTALILLGVYLLNKRSSALKAAK